MTEKKNFVPSDESSLSEACLEFQKTIKSLRGPEGCPWDREQTIETLKCFLVEEAYEAVHAASKISVDETNSYQEYCEELGDVLLQVFLNAAIAEEQGHFSITDVFKSINTKMIRRHPHVFAKENSTASTVKEVLAQWAEIKKTEKGMEPQTKDHLFSKARKKSSLPTLAYGCEISKRSLELGFSWMILKDIFRDLESEIQELSCEVFSDAPNVAKIADEAGDVIYSLCNVITFLKQKTKSGVGLDLDIAARGSFEKFLLRFSIMEKIMEEKGQPLTEERALSLNLKTWEDLWAQAKARLAKSE